MIKALTFGRVRYKQLRGLIGLPIHTPQIHLTPSYVGQAASDVIKEQIISDKPCMIARIGTAEFYTFLRYLSINKPTQYPLQKSFDYILKQAESFWWDERVRTSMSIYVGFFPPTNENLNRFCEHLLADIKHIDILGSWIADEYQVIHLLNNPIIINLPDLEPYYHEHPWSEALVGKTVLVIHPFTESIQRQYEKRQLLFPDPRVLPDFNLKTLKAVQSIAGNPCGFNTWFEALDWMVEQINQTPFDVAIIGAGAYGLPLAAHVKRLGKKAVHLGGATQILFGIRGKRWDEMPFFQKLYNEHWVRPLPSEVPTDHQRVEGGCYW
ncbi:hypothetical protein [Gloeomargarita lithophora]|uniref:hypothetical protein n=1 Tax=Gloeomargarita lithophora TaxID=1188228 RepID=UPI003F718E03